MFYKHSCNGKITILIVYVDGIILTRSDGEMLRLKKALAQSFEIKDLGNLRSLAQSRKGIVLSQRKYVLNLLKETSMLVCKPIDTLIDVNIKMSVHIGGKEVDREGYQRLVGKLIYLSHTRPDIAFVVSLVSQFMHNPKEDHLQAVFRIFRYLKGSPGRGLLFSKQDKSLDVEAFTDVDWASSVDDRRPTSSYYIPRRESNNVEK